MSLSFCCAAGSLLLRMAPGCSCLAAFLLRPAPCRRFVLPSAVGYVLEVPSRPQVRPGPALAEGQLASCKAPHAWPQACSWRHTTLQARARCSGRSTGRHRVWGSGLVSGRGRIPTRACGTYVHACEDGHAHAPRAGPSLVVYILQAASATAVDVNRAPRPAGGASGRGAPQRTTGPASGPRAPSRLWDLAQCAAKIGFEAARRLDLKQRRRHLPKAILIV